MRDQQGAAVHREIRCRDLPEAEQVALAEYLAGQTGLSVEAALVELRRGPRRA